MAVCQPAIKAKFGWNRYSMVYATYKFTLLDRHSGIGYKRQVPMAIASPGWPQIYDEVS